MFNPHRSDWRDLIRPRYADEEPSVHGWILVVFAIVFVALLGCPAQARERISSPRPPSYVTLQQSCFLSNDNAVLIEEVAAFVAANQPAPPALTHALEVIDAHRGLLAAMTERFWCAPPSALCLAIPRHQTDELYSSLQIVIHYGELLRAAKLID